MTNTKNPFNIIVIVAALGYFVDIYDLILFSIVRVPSLISLGLTGDEITRVGLNLLNTQMIGMLVGGIVWGILGDKKGRLSVLFGTILLYSLANIANGFVQTINQYYVWRFIAGLGLAGELGIGITLVAEVMSKENRGYGTTIVSGIGIFGAVAGFLVADLFDWRMAYFVGGGLGLLLLVMRVSVFESGMYSKLKTTNVRRGSFSDLFTSKTKLWKYIRCILIGVPVWYIIGIIVTVAPEFASAEGLGVTGSVNGGKAVMYHYIGASMGAFITGLISQWWQSRKKALLLSLFSLSGMLAVFFMMKGISTESYYLLLFLLGLPNGYWSVFVTNASEQFGTNLRATVSTSVPNFVRGMTVVMTNSFLFLKTGMGLLEAAAAVGIVVMALAILSTVWSEESFHKNLDYTE